MSMPIVNMSISLLIQKINFMCINTYILLIKCANLKLQCAFHMISTGVHVCVCVRACRLRHSPTQRIVINGHT